MDFRTLGGGAWGTFVHGSSRTVVLRLVYAMARANDPNPTWVDIRDTDLPVDPPGPTELGWIPENHLYLVCLADAKPQDAVANMALWNVVRSDEPSSVIGEFRDFLRLPPTIQDAVSRVGAEPSRPVFVIANSDRLRAYYPKDVGGVRPIINAMLHGGVLPLFAAAGAPGEGRLAFDFVFEVRAPDLDHWRTGSLVCEKAPPGTSVSIDTPIPLASLTDVSAYLEATPESSRPPRKARR